jgi:Protein of unknown function (DUF742)
MPPPDEEREWADAEAGPIVRPYALTGGRTRHGSGEFDLITLIKTVEGRPPSRFQGGPEHRRILRLCTSALSVAEIASELDLPVDVVRVLLGDLADHDLIIVRQSAAVTRLPGHGVLKQVLDGLHAL